MKRNYINSVRLSSPVDEASYLHNLPVVRHLAHFKTEVTCIPSQP